jgi:hypothetical protein
MIRKLWHKLWQKLKELLPEEKTVELELVEEFDPTRVYDRLKLAIGQVGSTQLQLNASPASLGRIESFADNLAGLLKSLVEVNAVLKDHNHIENGLFYMKNARSAKLDHFMFVQNGFYVRDVADTLQKVLEQIDVYYELMKNADKAMYGVMEHNHRQLYTESLVVFLTAIFDHFGE